MASNKFLLALSLSLLVSSVIGERSPLRLTEQQQCRFRNLNAAQPSRQIQHEGGITEIWDESQDQFQCAGVVAMRNTLRPNSLSLPNYHPTPRLVFIERGQGYIAINFPGCAETYHTQRTQTTRESRESWEEKQQGSTKDLHQKVHRIRRGDIVAIPAGAAHWCYNDGNEELVAVSINDLNHQSNQLDQKLRAFYMAGGMPRSERQEQGEQGQQSTFQNIFRAFDPQLLSEAYNVPKELIRRMQSVEEERGLIINVRERMSFIRPDEQEEEEQIRDEANSGLAETICTMKIRTNIENVRQADVYSREAGKVNIADRNKLPILKFMDMSAEKGTLYPNAMLSPDWSLSGHTIVYVTKGEAHIQIANHNGQTIMNERASKGSIFVVPQYFTTTTRAGSEGFEWVSFKTTGVPIRNTIAGYTSIMRAMPLQVLTNVYQISPNQARQLKMNRGGQSVLLSPSTKRQYIDGTLLVE